MKRLVAETYVTVKQQPKYLKKHTIVIPIDINIVIGDDIAAATQLQNDEIDSFINTIHLSFIANGYELAKQETSNRPKSYSEYLTYIKKSEDHDGVKLKVVVFIRVSDHNLSDRGPKVKNKDKKSHSKKGKQGLTRKDMSGKALHKAYTESQLKQLQADYPGSTPKVSDNLITVHPVDGLTYDQAIEKVEHIIKKFANL